MLTGVPAAIRHKQRIERAIKDIEQDLFAIGERLQQITDAQYEFITVTIAEVFATVQQDKIESLRAAIRNGITEPIEMDQVQSISRVVRDISVNEARFLLDSIEYPVIHIGHEAKGHKALNVSRDSPEIVLLNGLLSLGLVVPSDTIYLDVQSYQFSPIAKKVAKLLTKGFQEAANGVAS